MNCLLFRMHIPSVDRLLLHRIKVFLWIVFTNNHGHFYASVPAFALLTFLVAILGNNVLIVLILSS